MQDGKQRTFILIDDDQISIFGTEVFKGKHVVGYMEPYAFENTIYKQNFYRYPVCCRCTNYSGCRSYHYMVDGGKHVYLLEFV